MDRAPFVGPFCSDCLATSTPAPEVHLDRINGCGAVAWTEYEDCPRCGAGVYRLRQSLFFVPLWREKQRYRMQWHGHHYRARALLDDTEERRRAAARRRRERDGWSRKDWVVLVVGIAVVAVLLSLSALPG